jgi:PKD repeat protein/pimeloyl-ACP methyl ester carboxylesterase
LKKEKMLKKSIYISLISTVHILFIISISYSAKYTTIQLTNSDYSCYGPQINDNDHVVWFGDNGSGYNAIFLYDGSTTIQLTNNDFYNDIERYQINNNGHVVWSKYRYGDSGVPFDSQIFLYDGSTTILLNSSRSQNYSPQISDNGHVVWFGEGYDDSDTVWQSDIFLYDGSTTKRLTNSPHNSHPKINSNGHVAWSKVGYLDSDNVWQSDIFLYNGSTTKRLINPGFGDDSFQINDNGHVVWRGYNGSNSMQIFLYDGSIIKQLTNSSYNVSPQINDNGHVVWSGHDGSGYNAIFLYDGSTTTQLTNSGHNHNPQINNNGHVVWSGYTDLNGGWHSEIFLYDGSTTTQLTNSGYNGSPQINNNGHVVWYSWLRGRIFYAMPDELSGNVAIAQTPMTGLSGTTFVEWGTGFTPNSTATLHFKKPDGTEYPTLQQPIDAIGHFEIDYIAPRNKPPGTYIWWAIDGVTGEKSNEVAYVITQPSSGLVVETINPQSSHSFYKNFFPSPDQDKLDSGGSISSIIAADGESRLLLRITADSPCQVTVSEEKGNISQNGGVAILDDYRNAELASSVKVQVEKPYGGKYVGYAVYRTPRDFSIPGYEDKLTRTITLKIDSPSANKIIPITLRRTPIIISHGLWSYPNNEMENFRDDLWNRFTDRSDKNVNDYIRLNNCQSENAKAVSRGAIKTTNNIYAFLDALRSQGVTVTQVDYLGHSMGGLWGRLVVQEYNKKIFTYDEGYLHKLITLDTPHGGSYLADIGQFIIDNAGYISIHVPTQGFISARDFLCQTSTMLKKPVCDGAIRDLTSYGNVENLQEISIPAHAFTGNKSIDTACALLSLSKLVSGADATGIVTLLRTAEKILKLINPDYGCENWINKFDIQTQSDYVVGLGSQTGGLKGDQLDERVHWHMASFTSEINSRFYELLNKWSNESVFSSGFPASASVVNQKAMTVYDPLRKTMEVPENQEPLGEIQFTKPVTGVTVLPGEQVNVELTLTGSLSLNNVLIMAKGSEPIEITDPPYTTFVIVPLDAYGTFDISALGEGTDGNLYTSSVTITVNNSAMLEKVDVSPTALTMEPGQQISLEVIGSYSDGSTRSLNQKTAYIRSNGDILSVNSSGTITAISIGLGFIQVSPVYGDPVIVRVEISAPYMDADFISDLQSGVAPFAVKFTDFSAGDFTKWNWDFGDNQTSTEQNPVHVYSTSGTYTVNLTITNTSGTNTETKTNFITVGTKGDINMDGQIDLTDGFLIFQILTGMSPEGTINLAADVDGDGKIGLKDFIYIIQNVEE